MRFFSTLLAGAAIVAGVLAQKPTIDKYPKSVKAGESVEITYSPATATAKFVLRKGSPGNLATLATLTENATGGKYTWNVPEDLANASDYALQIVVNGEDNYTGLISLSGGSSASSSSSASASSGSATSSPSPTSSGTKSVSASITSSSVSGSITSSAHQNSTVTSATLSTARSTGSSQSSATTTGSSPPESTGAASMLSSSPLALIFGAVAAMAYLN
ncbi:hypothetical protein BU24DRAFT_66265 [Aaosphaeria arxii CBS 175.79]|uniref:Yeast cell wall synthesis Kre9/Knh1-like N-terminal domain-containing protein n=1 Tax=Aaosphaeria arxii CBS 175.79 TaxID=1450172 RepID=A0A6A5XA65_9PLEO|nr:uncharacterized protein BU24DRAFT_66265 [Aaosphaeria arxii CBS 175.79]KAF2009868.1 hypothetical protein BU24DRAFT_66265 [Aaosphaeria arxii CBS 175.79]